MNAQPVQNKIPVFSFVNLIFFGFALTLPLWVFQRDLPGLGLNLFMLGTLPLYLFGPMLMLGRRVWISHKAILFFFVAMHALYINPNVASAYPVEFAFQIAACLVFYVLFVNAVDKVEIYSRAVKVMLLSSAVIAAYLIYLYYFVYHSLFLNTYLNPEDLYYRGRIGKNTLSFFLALIFPFAYSLFSHKKNLLNLSVLLVLATGIFYTFSRMGLLSMGFTVMVAPLFSPQRRRYFALTFIVLGVLGILKFHYNMSGDTYMAMRDPLFEENIRKGETKVMFTKGEHRERLFMEGLEEFLEHPLWGKGVASYRIEKGSDSHNDYILILWEFGLFGLILFLGILALHFFELIRIQRNVDKNNLWLWEGQVAALLNLAFMLNAINAYDIIPSWFILAGCATLTRIYSPQTDMRSA